MVMYGGGGKCIIVKVISDEGGKGEVDDDGDVNESQYDYINVIFFGIKYFPRALQVYME